MKIIVRWMPALLLGVALARGPAVAAPGPTRCEAGPPAADGAARQWSGDFDGDRKVDRLWLLPPGSQPSASDPVRDPWKDRLRRFDASALTLVVAASSPAAGCTLIQNRAFFATPIWEEGEKPLKVLVRSDPAARDWRRLARGWRGDGVLLGTEAGVDVLLFWDGRRFRIARSGELP